jgi:hypothetical protein
MMAKRRRKYTGKPFPTTAYARMTDDGEGEQMVEFWEAGNIGDFLNMNEPTWVATYKRVSVRRLKRTVKVVKA